MCRISFERSLFILFENAVVFSLFDDNPVGNIPFTLF